MNINSLTPFVRQYLETALWSATEDQIHDSFSIEDFADTAIEQSSKDCESFIEQAGKLMEGLDQEQCGHDFSLTRNHHGTGFWDRGLGDKGKAITKICHEFGEADLYLGDDGKLYFL